MPKTSNATTLIPESKNLVAVKKDATLATVIDCPGNTAIKLKKHMFSSQSQTAAANPIPPSRPAHPFEKPAPSDTDRSERNKKLP
jgi:hypothetical protein